MVRALFQLESEFAFFDKTKKFYHVHEVKKNTYSRMYYLTLTFWNKYKHKNTFVLKS